MLTFWIVLFAGVIHRIGGLENPTASLHAYHTVIHRIGGLENHHHAIPYVRSVIHRIGGLENKKLVAEAPQKMLYTA